MNQKTWLLALFTIVLAYILGWCPLHKFVAQRCVQSQAKSRSPGPLLGTRERFELVFPSVREELGTVFTAQGMPEDAQSWFLRIMDYNVPGGKLNRGISVVDSAEIMRGRRLSDDEFSKAAVLGWAVEFLQASFLVIDDLMDKSITRRGQVCYYRLPEVGTIAVNDAVLLDAAIYQLLKRHFRTETYYVDLLELFHDTTFQTATGQLLDLINAAEGGAVDLSKISLDKFHLIAQYKTAHYSFYLPVALAMLITGIPTSYDARSESTGKGARVHPYEIARSILLPIGVYFQVQDDFLDFAGTPEQIGKVGTDIVDNKCSWCINTALGLANPEQRAVLDTNYGRQDPRKEAKVKGVFAEVGLHEKYREYEENIYAVVMDMINNVPEDGGVSLKREVFTHFLHKIYKRTK